MKHAWLSPVRLGDIVLITAAADNREILIRFTLEEAKRKAEEIRQCAEETP